MNISSLSQHHCCLSALSPGMQQHMCGSFHNNSLVVGDATTTLGGKTYHGKIFLRCLSGGYATCNVSAGT